MDYKALLLSNQQYLIPALAALLSFLGGRASVGTTPHSVECAPEIPARKGAGAADCRPRAERSG